MTIKNRVKSLTKYFRSCGLDVEKHPYHLKILPFHIVILVLENSGYKFYSIYDLRFHYTVYCSPEQLILKLIRYKILTTNQLKMKPYYYRNKFKYPLKNIKPFFVLQITATHTHLLCAGNTLIYSNQSFTKLFTLKPKYDVKPKTTPTRSTCKTMVS